MKHLSEESYRIWLNSQPMELCVVLTAREALRVWPILTTSPEGEAITLASARSIMTAFAAVKFQSNELKIAADRSGGKNQPTGKAYTLTWDAAYHATNAATSAVLATKIQVLNDAFFKRSSFVESFPNASTIHGYDIGDNPNEILNSLLWGQIGEHSDIIQLQQRGPSIIDGPEWAFWREWYQGFLEGKPMDWELQRRVALIPDEDWEKGAAHIAGVIEGIRVRFELEARISELEEELRNVTISRHGMGGNNPPETLHNTPIIAKELLIIWEPLQDIKEEVGAKNPDKSKIKKAMDALGSALKIAMKWTWSKVDLAIDTAIKKPTSASGAGIITFNHDKISAVIDAATAFLSNLP